MCRFLGEFWLFLNAKKGDVVLCFGNLPPLFPVRCRIVVFVQNRYTIQKIELEGFGFRDQVRIFTERLWFVLRMRHVSSFIVQTPAMKYCLSHLTQSDGSISVLPFKGGQLHYERKVAFKNIANYDYDFVYIASGEPHKNHTNLIEAWRLLADDGLFPSLVLTLEHSLFHNLTYSKLNNLKGPKPNIANIGKLSNEEAINFLSRCGALIYPSKFEAFGLPLIEARQAGLPVLASELDYVRDILDPEESFDPYSPVSIAKAVKRFLGVKDGALPLFSPEAFISTIINGVR
jgi:glycosyltransferase involved in cell wall biosynthesis